MRPALHISAFVGRRSVERCVSPLRGFHDLPAFRFRRNRGGLRSIVPSGLLDKREILCSGATSLRQCGAHVRLTQPSWRPRGKLIALEGIDGSGKRTQLDLLARELDARGLATLRISFPRYESFFGKLVGRYLNGEFGSLGRGRPAFFRPALCRGPPGSEARARSGAGGGENCAGRPVYRLESGASERTRPAGTARRISRLAEAPRIWAVRLCRSKTWSFICACRLRRRTAWSA